MRTAAPTWAVIAFLPLWACSGSAQSGPVSPPVAAPATPPGSAPIAPMAPGDSEARARGTPHLTAIERIELSPAGDAAITRDTNGRLRFWASLDGKSEPLPIPIATASHFALARAKAGHARRAWTIALVDTAGGAHLLRADASGAIERLSDLPASLKLAGVQVLPGGERALFLRQDRVIELRDARGALVARYDRRGFRPLHIWLANAGKFVALEADPAGRLTIHPMQISESPAGAVIKPKGEEHTIDVKRYAIGGGQAALAPSGRHFAFLAHEPKKNIWEAMVVDLDAREHRAIPLALFPGHQLPGLGFVEDTRLVARGGANLSTWLIELDGKSERMRPLAARPDITHNAARAFARGVMVIGLGNWLYVHRPRTRESLYLGYDQFSPTAAAVSSSGEVVAWGSGNDLYVTSIGGERLAERELLRSQTARYLAFVDDRRLLIAYYTGALELYDWKDDKILATVDGGGTYLAGGYDPASRLFFIIPQSGQVWVTEITRTGFRGPHVVADGAVRAGFLDGGRALWTIDNRNWLRHYTIAELRAGISSDDVSRRGGLLGVSAIAVTGGGRLYATTYTAGRTHLTLYPAPEVPAFDRSRDPASTPRIELGSKELARVPMVHGVSLVEVAPAGDRVGLVSNNVVYVRGGSDLAVGWSYPFPNGVRSLSWNDDGTYLAVTTREGAVVLDAETGKPKSSSCGPHFSARRTPPANLFPPSVTASVCEGH